MERGRFLRPWRAVALALQYDRLGMFEIRQRLAGTETADGEWLDGEGPLWARRDGERVAALVRAALERLPARRRRHTAVQVALPDPVVQSCTMTVQQWPGTGRERQRFAEWLVGDGLGLDPAAHVVTWTGGALRGDGYRVMACAAPRAIVRAIESAVHDAGMGVSIIDAAAHFRVRYWRAASRSCGGVAYADGDYLGIVAWDGRGAPLHRGARWHCCGTGDAVSVADWCAREIERQLRLYPALAEHLQSARLVLEGSPVLTEALHTILSERYGPVFTRVRGLRVRSRRPRAVEASGNPGLAAVCW